MIGTNIVKAGYRTKLFECWRPFFPNRCFPIEIRTCRRCLRIYRAIRISAASVGFSGKYSRNLRESQPFGASFPCPGRSILQPEPFDACFAGVEPSETDRVRSTFGERFIRYFERRPALDAARPAGLTADDEGYEQYAENVPHHISPRPVFLSFPSSVSASTILSSTPLIKVLLPGVE